MKILAIRGKEEKSVKIRVIRGKKNMTDIAIRVENLSKQYRIGGPQARYKTIRESLTETVQNRDGETRGWGDKGMGRQGASRRSKMGFLLVTPSPSLLVSISRITEPTEGYAEIHGRVGSLLEVSPKAC